MVGPKGPIRSTFGPRHYLSLGMHLGISGSTRGPSTHNVVQKRTPFLYIEDYQDGRLTTSRCYGIEMVPLLGPTAPFWAPFLAHHVTTSKGAIDTITPPKGGPVLVTIPPTLSIYSKRPRSGIHSNPYHARAREYIERVGYPGSGYPRPPTPRGVHPT